MDKTQFPKARLRQAIRILCAGAAFIVCMLIFQPPPSIAQAPASRIALQGGFGDIRTVNPDGTGLTQLTSNSGFNHEPAFSRDGTRIAFTSDRTGNDEVYVMKSDGAEQTRLTSSSDQGFRAASGSPSFSGDGTRIAYVVGHDSYYTDIHVMNSDGSGQRAITTTGLEVQPAFSPDGTQIAFTSFRNQLTEIYRMNADGSGQSRLTTPRPQGFASEPAFSPDGRQIAYISNDPAFVNQIFIMNADGSGQTQLTQGSHSFDRPVFSPDGARIACVTDIGDGSGIYVMNVDGTNLKRVADGQAPSWGGAASTAIEVNTTGDEPDADPNDGVCDVDLNKPGNQCTLRAAIQVANARPGKDKITFNIPSDDPGIVDGVAMIRPKTALPAITESVTIDGWSQSPASTTPTVQIDGAGIQFPQFQEGPVTTSIEALFAFRLSWAGAASGLILDNSANGCELKGLSITRFSLFGIEIQGPRNTVQGCNIGIDAKGLVANANGLSAFEGEREGLRSAEMKGAGIVLQSPSNQVGGTIAQQRNLISGTSSVGKQPVQPPGLVIAGPNATGNVVEGNYFSSAADGMSIPATSTGEIVFDAPAPYAEEDIAIINAPGNRIGGLTPEAANYFIGVKGQGEAIVIAGQNAIGNTIQGNSLGYSAARAEDKAKSVEVEIQNAPNNLIGGSEQGAGNVFAAYGAALVIGGQGNVVMNNVIGPGVGASARYTGGTTGVRLQGDTTKVIGNSIANTLSAGIQISESNSIIQNNDIFNGGPGGHGIQVLSGGHSLVEANRIHDITGDGIAFVNTLGSLAVRITANMIYNNSFGISLTGQDAPAPNDTDGVLNHPMLTKALASRSSFNAQGSLFRTRLGSATYRVEFFASRISRTGWGEGERFLGGLDVTTNYLGQADFTFAAGAVVQPGELITATTTDPQGNTSEFSKAIVAHSGNDKDRDGVDDEIENQVPNGANGPTELSATPITQEARTTEQPTAGFGDGNGDGVLDSLQENVASFLSIKGNWLTLASPVGTSFVNVEPTGLPDFTQLPAGYSFPVAFMSFTLTGVPTGGSVSVTNILHDPFNVSTVFAYGPTPDNSQPHWYEFLFDGTTGAKLVNGQVVLSFKDGARGDHDLASDGQITTILAPAIAPALLNISTRLKVTAGGDNLGIGGFIISGGAKDVLIRGLGPVLTNFNLQNVLADPNLTLHTTDSAGADVVLATNDNWKIDDQTQASQEQMIKLTGLPPVNDAESAILITLPPGAYTAQLRGKDGGTGIGLVEVYDLSPASGSILANISTRGFVDTGDNVMIGGFIIEATSTVTIRALGPSMSTVLSGILADPNVSLHDANGMRIAINDDWQQDAEASLIPDRLKPTQTHESALHRTLAPGAYTAIVRGKGDATGIGLVEVWYGP